MLTVAFIVDRLTYVMDAGGIVMWPLLGLSVVAMILGFERCWFWVSMNNPARLARFDRVGHLLRGNKRDEALKLIENDHSVYGEIVRRLVEEGHGDAVVTDAVESQRPRLERFMPTLSTIITAAPMLGILGTVFGIIYSFQVLSTRATVTDPRNVSIGIAEALITTAAGLVVALVVLFPYNAFRAQIDRALGRIASLVAAASPQDHTTDSAANPVKKPISSPE